MSQTPSQLKPARRTSVVQWVIAAFLGAIAVCLVIEVGIATSSARAQSSPSGRGGLFGVAGQVTRDTYGLYLVDADSGTICVYEYVPDRGQTRKLRLTAARNAAFDLKLDDYNTEPLPREIKTLVEQARRLSATSQP